MQWLHETYDCKRICVNGKNSDDECCQNVPEGKQCLPDNDSENPASINVSFDLIILVKVKQVKYFSMNLSDEISMVAVNSFILLVV